ncbi:MAG: RNA polymerase factor sigma-54 [Chloroherpetonaceae bacterium]|nr:RNA polymerase factor sigma-54 [Chthonomonadaceae bacterium]MDW8206717.1 RNA polymerase factor sigma-54 [Chloroherpetonaceae bacterium]
MLRQEQRQVIAQRIDPKIIMANTILQLTSMELVQTIENELIENPALEALDEQTCDGSCLDPNSCPYCSVRSLHAPEGDLRNEALDSGDYESEYDSGFSGVLHEGDEDFDPIGNLEAEMTLQEHLRGLLRAAVPAEDYWIGEYIINNLNERGWLDTPVESIACELGVSVEDVTRLLEAIQSLEPPGVGARNLQECLLLQLRFLRDDNPDAPDRRLNLLAEALVSKHYEHVAAARYSKMARAVGITTEEARQVMEYIRTRLNPFPAAQFRPPWAYRPSNSKSVVRPDVIIRRTELGYEVEVLGTEPFTLGINPTYREAYNQIKNGIGNHSEEEKKHFTEYVERAELFIRNLNQRRHTLRMITRCIIDCQAGFLETGSRQFLRPLTRTRVAKMLSIHESTVSRATANKFVQLPNQEVVPFSIFFNSSLSIKDAIEEIIQDEDPSNPYSDQQIADLLKARGIPVARRTIVKYREAQKILSSTRRRR